ncbi:MAG: hypothetical protein GOU98_03485 [Candidatus Altiarchaeota archaeon]|nr:hypothetical protein [Candidatus Altiarchaeota archaeon]
MNKKILVLFLLMASASAWWDPTWNKSKSLSPDKNTSLFIGHLILDTKALITSGNLRFDCGDLRVTNNEVLVNYYLVGCNSTKTSVLFDVDNSFNEFSEYYGNPAAGSDSTSSLFNFFDNFDSYSLGTSGTPIWTNQLGSFDIKYIQNSRRYSLNSSSESIATSYVPFGNFTVYGELIDSEKGMIGLMYSYVNTTHYYAAYLNDTDVWVREGVISRNLGSFTNESINRLWVNVFSGSATVFVNGVLVGSSSYSLGQVGIYSNTESESNASVDNFGVFTSQDVSWSQGVEKNRPKLVFQFLGSEAANMRSAVAYMTDQKYTLKIQTESDKRDGLVENNFATLDWANISFNSTGYFVNSTFFEIDSDEFNFTQGRYRFDLTYVKNGANNKIWHIIQFFENYPAIKHVVFVTANNTDNHVFGVTPWASCNTYVSNLGSVVCGANMHSPSGIFTSGGADFCGLHYGKIGPSNFYENVSIVDKKQHKKIFWQSYMGCEDFTEEVEIYCGVDYFNCTATSIKPVKILFNVNDKPGALSRMEIPSGFTCKINGEHYTDLVDSSRINKGINDLECFGNGNLTYFKFYTSNPYEATRFFSEKPKAYSIEVTGPLSRGKINICGVPIVDKIMTHKCSGDNLFFEHSFLEGRQTFYLFKTDKSWSYKEAQGGQVVPTKISEVDPPQLPLAGAKEIGEPTIPPTHKVISSRRIFYSNQTSVEVLITAWRSI